MSSVLDSGLASSLQLAVALSPFAGTHPDPHHLLWALDFDGPLDPHTLVRALDAVVARHPALRSTFRWRNGRFEVQQRPDATVAMNVVELAPEQLDAAAQAFGEAPYDLQHGPFWRFRLVRLTAVHHVLLCGFHHLVMDGTSWPVLVRDLAAALAGQTLPPPPAGPGIAMDADAARAFWRDHVRGLDSVFELPADAGSGGARTSAGSHLTVPLPPSVAASLRAAAGTLGASPFRIALSAFTALLARLARRDDIALGTALTGRALTGDDAVGFYVNLSLLRFEIGETTTLRQLCTTANDALDAVARHQAWPLREAARAFGLSRDPRQNAFTESAFVKLPRRVALRAGSLSLRDRRIFLNGVDRDLCVYFQDTGEGYELTWTWRPARFAAATIARWQTLFVRLFDAALRQPDLALDRLDLVAPEERRRLLDGVEANRHDFAGRDVLHRLVEAQVARAPGRIAAVSPSRTWTYAQINAAANRLAFKLMARGVGKGAFVPLLMHPSPEMLIAELAVMKSGAGFVPLSPDWPAARIGAIVARLRPAAVLTNGMEGNPAGYDVIDIGDDDADTDPGNPDVAVDLDDAIYCIFTSGSTGAPKGAVNRHRGIVNRLLSMTHHLGSPEEDTVLCTAAATIDTLTWQYFWPLIHGGRCVTAPPGDVVVPESLCRLVERFGVTVLDFVPSVFKALVRHLRDHDGDFSTVRLAIVGGETMNPQDTNAFHALWPAVHLVNTYGPTETSIGVLWHRVTGPVDGPIPIGRPFDNIVAVIVDRHGALLPQGLAGELWIGGDCMGLGYLDDPVATAEKFVANPFPELRCATLYRTGDLARMRADGLIDYLGRLDDQLKILGHRVEPGEIEATLQAHPAVDAAVVTATPGGGLTAHLVVREAAPVPGVAGLREWIAARLPRHMVPNGFVRVPHLPVRPGGKIDRAAMARLAGEPLREARVFASPEGPDEIAVAEAWRTLLECGPVGRHDNFFHDLGGDSLKALIFVMQWEERTGRRVEVSRLFEAPSVAAFARAAAAPPDTRSLLDRQRAHLSSWRDGRVEPEGFLFARNASGTRPPLFWCCQGYEELDQLARHLDPAQPVNGMRSGHLIMDYTPEAIAELAEAYAEEIDRFQPTGAILLGGNCQGAIIAHGTAAALKRRGRRIGPLILMEESDFRFHDGPVALLYGADSDLNPFKRGTDPEPVFRRAYPGGFSVAFIPGSHGRFFTPENVPGLAAAIEAVMAGAR